MVSLWAVQIQTGGIGWQGVCGRCFVGKTSLNAIIGLPCKDGKGGVFLYERSMIWKKVGCSSRSLIFFKTKYKIIFKMQTKMLTFQLIILIRKNYKVSYKFNSKLNDNVFSSMTKQT